MAEYIEVKNLTKKFLDGTSDEVTALSDINADIAEGEFICLVGPSGCGKTTFLRIIAGLETATSGSVSADGEVISEPNPKYGMVFQEYSLFPWLNVVRNVAFGLEMMGVEKEARLETARKYLKLVGLEEFEGSYPHELSGGMRQRVAIARALAADPKVLLMDEPFGALDPRTRNSMQRELLEIWERTKKTIIFVTHSIDEAVFLSDRIFVMSPRPGRVREIITDDIPRPRDRTSAEFGALRKRILTMMGDE